MSVRLVPPSNFTPDIVREHGWRDDRYHGVDQCGRCHGWGTVAKTEGRGDKVRRVLLTCAKCLGKGHA